MRWIMFIIGLLLIGLVVWNDFGFILNSFLILIGGFIFVFSLLSGGNRQ